MRVDDKYILLYKDTYRDSIPYFLVRTRLFKQELAITGFVSSSVIIGYIGIRRKSPLYNAISSLKTDGINRLLRSVGTVSINAIVNIDVYELKRFLTKNELDNNIWLMLVGRSINKKGEHGIISLKKMKYCLFNIAQETFSLNKAIKDRDSKVMNRIKNIEKLLLEQEETITCSLEAYKDIIKNVLGVGGDENGDIPLLGKGK